jgi:predicted O-linked N-acetylglucosamine transferase (SPINDLY family)
MTEPETFLFAAAQRRHTANDRTGALVLLDELLRVQPDHAPALLLLAELQLATNPVAAANAAHRVVQSNQGDQQAMELLARALSAMGRNDEALHAFRDIAAAKPANALVRANLAVSLVRAGDPRAAVAAAEQAIELDPAAPEAYAALGHAHNVLRQPDQAIAAFHKALSLRLQFPDALQGVARAYRDQGRPSTAISALLRATELAPYWTSPWLDLATLFREFGQPGEAMEALRKAIALAPDLPHFFSNLLLDMQYDPAIDEAQAAAEAQQWGVRQVAAVRPVALAADRSRDPARPLRIGYVSADFYRHPVGWLGSAPIVAHDRSAVTVFVYANQTAHDQLTESLKQSVDAWVPIMGLDDDTVAARVAADQIDILVDLAGHTAGNRLAVFARRPAPIQVTWLGYSATTGLPTMDYILLDQWHLGPETEQHMLERMVRLPQARFCYSPPDYAPEVAEPPSTSGKPVTFASFNNTAKLNDSVIALWSRVLLTVPDSRLLLKWRSLADPVLRARISRDFGRHGVDAGRIQFDGATQHADMLRQYSDVDVALDPFPFCGGLTSCEALWMGVPIVTLVGPQPFSRQTHAILHAIGRPEWSAGNADEYVETAARLAGDPVALDQLRRDLRRQIVGSGFCDGSRFARGLERIYRDMWSGYLAGR